MKKIFKYLLACAVIAVTFTSCHPLNNDELGAMRVAIPPPPPPTTISITLAAADYQLLPASNPANAALSFKTGADALTGIPVILAAKYPTASNKSVATVGYNLTAPAPVKLVDSLYSNILYVPTAVDYGGKFLDFSTAQAIAFIKGKYVPAVENQMVVLKYTYFESGVTPSSGTPNTIHSYIYMNGAWTKIYTISPAQYAAANRGLYNEFTAADGPNLVNIFNTFLKADPTVAGAAKVGTVTYISYNYYVSSKDYQRVQPLTFDGNNWVTASLTGSYIFAKANGTWSQTTSGSTGTAYTLIQADYTAITNIANIASADAIANLKAHPNFSLTLWTDAQINAAINAVLKTVFKSATKDQKFDITYAVYGGPSPNVTKTFTFDGTDFKVPATTTPTTSHTLGAADFTAIGASSIGTATQRANVVKYGDFDNTWSAADINSIMILVLTNTFPTPQLNVTYSITYTAYVTSAVPTTLNFTYDGTKWVTK